MDVQEHMEGCVSSMHERFGPQVAEMRQKIDQYNRKAMGFMKERPGTSLLVAIGLGFLVGKFVAGRR